MKKLLPVLFLLFISSIGYSITGSLSGFETGDLLDCIATAGTLSVQSATKRSGTYALQTNPAGASAGSCRLDGFLNTGAAGTSAFTQINMYSRFYFNYTTKPAANDEEIFNAVDTVSTPKFSIRLNSVGNLVFYDSTTIAISTGTTVLNSGTWYRIEVFTSTGAAGAWQVNIDGVLEASGSNMIGTSNNGSVIVGKNTNRNSKNVNFFFDDILFNNTGFLGASQNGIMVPVSTGTYTTWSTSGTTPAASQWQSVNEVPNDAQVTYLMSPLVIGSTETVVMQTAAAAGITGTVNSVRLILMVRKNAGTNSTIRNILRSNSVDSPSTADVTVSNGGVYVENSRVFDTDPTTGSAWTLSGLNTLEGGAAERSATAASNLTAVYVVVDYVPGGAATVIPQRTLTGVGL